MRNATKVKLRGRAAEKMQDRLPDADWFIPNAEPVKAGTARGYWVPVFVYVRAS